MKLNIKQILAERSRFQSIILSLLHLHCYHAYLSVYDNGPYSHYGHFFDSLHQLWGALAAIIIHPHSWYEEIIFSFELCDHTYQVKSCNRFLWKSPQRPLSRHFLATKNEKWKIEKLWTESRHFSFLAITWSVFIQINQTRFQMKVLI